MRIGNWRGLFFGIAALACWSSQTMASWSITDAFPWIHTIPRVTYAKDYRTGQQYYAPPIPYGHYAKDPVGHVYGAASGAVHGAMGHVHGAMSHLHNAVGTLCGACGGRGCGTCGNDGLCGNGNDACSGNAGCVSCGDGVAKTGFGHGHGHGGVVATAPAYVSQGKTGHGLFGGLFGHKKNAGAHATAFGHGVAPSAQASPIASPQMAPCGHDGCGLGGCGLGNGLGLFNHAGKGLGGPCGPCGGRGLLNGGLCGGCGGDGFCGNGNDVCSGMGQGLCNGCGGQGCGLCGGTGLLGHIKGKAHGLLGHLSALHPGNKVKYFVGPGGPVPLTPGYVPYINPVRSPRDFFAFPPFIDQAMDGADTSPYGGGVFRASGTYSAGVTPPPPAPGLGTAYPLGGRYTGAAPEAGLGAGGDTELPVVPPATSNRAFPLGGESTGAAPEAGLGAGGDTRP